MSINPITISEQLKALTETAGLNSQLFKTEETEGSFDAIFQSYLSMLSETSALQTAAEKAQLDFASGKTDDMLSVMLAQEKAYSTLNFTIQVTNKVVEMYREIMRMSM